MSKKSKFPTLKQEIKDREAASREICKRIHASRGLDRYEAWQEKRSEGNTTRCLLLMYAMLRGLPRHALESKYNPYDNYWLYNGMHHMAGQRNLALTKEAIDAWLSAPAPVVEAPAEEPARGAA